MASKSSMFSRGQQNIGNAQISSTSLRTSMCISSSTSPTKKVSNPQASFTELKDNVVPAALHNSGEISDPPKCHPGTRVDVLTVLITWALATVYGYPLRWLNGPAGAGKSAIMRSFAEMLVEKGLLLASFFFFRSDGRRNTAQYLISTIAYQLCLNIPSLQLWVECAIESNPLIFKYSLAIQIQTLIIDPFLHYFYDPNSTNISPFPRIILIDGLDECAGHGRQVEILDVLCRMVQTLPIPIAIVVASRPEHQIRSAFELGSLSKASSRIVLDDSFNPDEDIRHYYVTEFEKIRTSHPMRSYLGPTWPSQDVLRILIRNASGQFIYASTVVKFVRSNRHNPALRLQIVLGLADRGTSKPFQQLDNLYTVVFLNVDPEILPETLRVLGIILTPPIDGKPEYQSPKFLESLLGFSPGVGHIRYLLLDLESLLTVAGDGNGIRIYHTSLPDFLFDKSRAGDFFIDRNFVYEDIALSCILPFCRSSGTANSELSHPLLRFYFDVQLRISLQNASPTERLHRSIVSCDMDQLMNLQQPNGIAISRLAPLFLFGIKESRYLDAGSLYHMKLASFSTSIDPQLVGHWLCADDTYPWRFRLAFLFVLFLVLKPTSLRQAEQSLKYFPGIFTDDFISVLPGVTYQDGDWKRDNTFRTEEDWRLLSHLILETINSSTGLLHGKDGKDACTVLTVDVVQKILRHRSLLPRFGGSEEGLESLESLEAILPFLLNVALVRSDLVHVVLTARCQCTGARDSSKPMSGAVAVAIENYLQRIPEGMEVADPEVMDWEVTDWEMTTDHEALDQELSDQEASDEEGLDWELTDWELTDRDVDRDGY